MYLELLFLPSFLFVNSHPVFSPVAWLPVQRDCYAGEDQGNLTLKGVLFSWLWFLQSCHLRYDRLFVLQTGCQILVTRVLFFLLLEKLCREEVFDKTPNIWKEMFPECLDYRK